MARYNGPVCRLCRREGMKLFLKGERCYTESARSSATCRRASTTAAQGQDGGLACSCAAQVKRIYGVPKIVPLLFEQAERTRGAHRRNAVAAAGAPPG